MSNGLTSPTDPIFFLHHCQVDRIWAVWQQSHSGPSNYNPLNLGGHGHKIGDRMWPWDGGQSNPDAAVQALLPTFLPNDIVTPEDVLDHKALGYVYEGEESLLAAEGKVTFLRVHDVGTGWGPPTDFLDVEVVIKIDSEEDRAFGFQLRDDTNENTHRGMLDLLRDAFTRNGRVRIDYIDVAGLGNAKILRVLSIP